MGDVKHTPGPWRAVCLDVVEGRTAGDSGVRFWMIEQDLDGAYRGGICNVHQAEDIGGITIAERDANARLIAASPELLDSLVGYMSAVETMNAAMKDGLNVHGAVAALVGWEDMAKAAIAKATPSLHEGERG